MSYIILFCSLTKSLYNHCIHFPSSLDGGPMQSGKTNSDSQLLKPTGHDAKELMHKSEETMGEHNQLDSLDQCEWSAEHFEVLPFI